MAFIRSTTVRSKPSRGSASCTSGRFTAGGKWYLAAHKVSVACSSIYHIESKPQSCTCVCVCVCCTVFDLLDVFDSHDADGNGVVQIDDRIPATGGIEAQTGNSAVAFRKFHGGSGWFQWTNDLAAAPRQIAANLVAAASVSWSGIVVVSVIVVSSSPSSSRKYRLKSSFPLNQIDLERNGIVGCHGFNPMIQKDPALRGQLSKAGDTFGVSRRQSNVLFIQMDHSLHFQTRNVMNQGV